MIVIWVAIRRSSAQSKSSNSLVCLTEETPDNATACEHGWKAFRIQGRKRILSVRCKFCRRRGIVWFN
ncbi:MAG: hypothetical protein K2O40_06455 [Lachnospiraceae bacterium]|nr:hypothetical protein [Lachnospiraceae bacterium]